MARSLNLFMLLVIASIIQQGAAGNRTDRQLLSFCAWPEPFNLETVRPEFKVNSEHGTKYHTFHISHEHDIQPQVKKLEEGGFLRSRHVIFLVHGFVERVKNNYLDPVKDALIDRHNFTIIQVGWEHGADLFSYIQASSNTKTVGKAIGKVAKAMKDEIPALGDKNHLYLHCIGISLGGQICGQAGNEAKGMFDRISGLDPASPGFEECDNKPTLNKDSAKCVDVIHTNGFGGLEHFGYEKPMGYVDFYVNRGRVQPRCFSTLCNHVVVAKYYAYTIRGNPSFCRTQGPCEDHKDLPGSCPPNTPDNAQVMGYYSDCHHMVKKEARRQGIFHIEINKQEDYC